MKARIRHFKGERVRIKPGTFTGNKLGICLGFDRAADNGKGKYRIDFENGFVGWYKRCEFEVLSP